MDDSACMETPTPTIVDALARIESSDNAALASGAAVVYAIEICTPTLGCNTYIRRVAKDRRDAVAIGRAYARAAGIKHAGIRAHRA